MRKLNCFIACAFGIPDVDDIYKLCIQKALKELNIIPKRVDKIDFVGKIDLKIIKLIKESDFCIADLTYARPSVYFEAGYAEGLNKKVIYSVRNDHFKGLSDDEYGNCKVHFDKITDKIISWKNPSKVFIKKLKKIIKIISEPMMGKIINEEKIKKEQEKFNKIPLNDRISKINLINQKHIIDKGYEHLESVKDNIFYKKSNQNKYIGFTAKNIFTKIQLESYDPLSKKYHYTIIDQIISRFKIPKYSNLILIFNSLRKISDLTIESVLSDFKRVPNTIIKEYIYGKYSNINKYYYIIIDDIKCESDYKNKLASIKII